MAHAAAPTTLAHTSDTTQHGDADQALDIYKPSSSPSAPSVLTPLSSRSQNLLLEKLKRHAHAPTLPAKKPHIPPSRRPRSSAIAKPSRARIMNLTPIQIRGKRRTPVTKAPVALQQDQKPPKPKRTLSTVLLDHMADDRPTLESLPSEILEGILLYSASLALPQASPILGVKLSEKATLLRFFIWAFHETWDEWFGIPTSQTLLHGPPVIPGGQKPPQADPQLQTAVLKQPWVTIDFILLAQQVWADNYGTRRWYQHSTPWNQEPDEVCHSHRGGVYHFNARECFEVDYQQALKWPPFRVEALPWGTQEVHPKTRLPTDLLTGPWNDEQLRRLFWLTRGGMMVNSGSDATIPWEIKVQFLRNAILDVEHPQVLAINCLMGAWLFKDLPQDIVRQELAGIDRRLQWGDDSETTKYILERTRKAMTAFLDHRSMRRSSV